jgi:hypothetical protein
MGDDPKLLSFLWRTTNTASKPLSERGQDVFVATMKKISTLRHFCLHTNFPTERVQNVLTSCLPAGLRSYSAILGGLSRYPEIPVSPLVPSLDDGYGCTFKELGGLHLDTPTTLPLVEGAVWDDPLSLYRQAIERVVVSGSTPFKVYAYS